MYLTNGNQGNDVEQWQVNLVSMGFGVDLGNIDGIFGDLTEQATRDFQSYYNIQVDGIVGNQSSMTMRNEKLKVGVNGTQHFNIEEFRCKGSGNLPSGGMDNDLLLKLEILRYELGHNPVIINSGYRSTAHNRAVGGAPSSQHTKGTASDIQVRGQSHEQVYNVADKVFSSGGVGKYNTHTHVDTRGYRARW